MKYIGWLLLAVGTGLGTACVQDEVLQEKKSSFVTDTFTLRDSLDMVHDWDSLLYYSSSDSLWNDFIPDDFYLFRHFLLKDPSSFRFQRPQEVLLLNE